MGHDVVAASLQARRQLGYVPEDAPLYTHMRVREFLGFMGRVRGLDGAGLQRAIDEVVRNGSRSRTCRRADRPALARLPAARRDRAGAARQAAAARARRADQRARPAPDHRDARADPRAVAGAGGPGHLAHPRRGRARRPSRRDPARRPAARGARARRRDGRARGRCSCSSPSPGGDEALPPAPREGARRALPVADRLDPDRRLPRADGLFVHAHAVQQQVRHPGPYLLPGGRPAAPGGAADHDALVRRGAQERHARAAAHRAGAREPRRAGESTSRSWRCWW